MEVYGDWNFQAPEYIEPNIQTGIDTRQLQQEYVVKVRQLEEELEAIRHQAELEQADEKMKRRKASKNFMRRQQLTEDETRIIIDQKLRAAGWEVDTNLLNYKKTGRYQRKKQTYGHC
ncbi:hypothetical protein BsIDN1_49600 [Bacillus safensis]|uniref:Uncharacterized protein n=1 Tax=Bacillus safensis TaxID=561879 RepID=A0A5S9MFE6_BACIA|nr:hypothetical protein BsIDN1_49600 [Bacillus safensis]